MTLTTDVDAQAAEQIDPRAVPVYPIIRMEARETETGTTYFLERQPVELDDREPLAVLVEAAALKAEQMHRSPQAIRARLKEAAQERELVVAAEGTWWDVGQLKADDAAAAPAEQRSALRLYVACAVAALVIFGLIVGVMHSLRSDPPAEPAGPPVPQAIQLPAINPDGTGRVARWASPELAAPGGRATAVRAADAVVVLTADRRLVALDPANGGERWSSPVGVVTPTAGPVVSRIDGEPVIAVASAQAIQWWPLAGPAEPRSVTVPSGGQPSLGSDGPLVTYADRHQAQVIVGGQFQDRVLPAGAKALGVTDGGVLLAGDDAGHVWRITSDRVAPEPTTLLAPKTVRPAAALTVAAGKLLTLWRETATRRVVVTAYDTATIRPVWAARLAAGASQYATTLPPWQVSPDGRWAVIGGTAFDVADGRFVDLDPTWQQGVVTDVATLNLTKDRWARHLGAARTVPALSTADATRREAFALPVVETDDLVFVTAADGQATRLYALPKEH